MGTRQATVYVDYQQRATEFSVGDLAYPLAGGATDESQAGTVSAVWPAIGQVDIDFAWGSGRYPVEDVQRVTNIVSKPPKPEHSTVPGGAGSVGVPGGPKGHTASESLDRVAHAFVKSALYWASKNRHYRATKAERDSGRYACPKKCHGEGDEPSYLRPANYKRNDGQSHRLLGCPHCLFLIKREDILGDSNYIDDESDEGLVADWDGSMDQGFDLVRGVKAAEEEDLELIFPFVIPGNVKKALKSTAKLLNVTVSFNGKKALFKGKRKDLETIASTLSAHSISGKKSAEDGAILTVKFSRAGDGADSVSKMLAYIGKIGGVGHSFGITVDPENSEYRKSFGFDGDGADRITSVTLDGKKVGAT